MAWHAVELATTSANVAAAILIMVIVAGHNGDRAHPKEKPRGEEAGPWKVYRAWEPDEARPAHLPAGGRRQCDVRGTNIRLSIGSGRTAGAPIAGAEQWIGNGRASAILVRYASEIVS